MDKQLAFIAASDLHFSSKPPLFRSEEPSWLKTQISYLRQLLDASVLNLYEKVPILLPGDIFHKPNTSHEIINLIIKEIKRKNVRIYSIPGNHDLPNHRWEELKKSAYGTLVEAGCLINVVPNEPVIVEEGKTLLRLWGFPCGYEVQPLENPNGLYLEVALVHAYIWGKNSGYEGAPETQRISNYRGKLKGYDIAIFGDNHKGFVASGKENGECPIINCGAFFIRKSDEREYKPCFYLVYTDCSVEKRYLNIENDKYVEGVQEQGKVFNNTAFVSSLLELGEQSYDFPSYVKRAIEQEEIKESVKSIMLESLEHRE